MQKVNLTKDINEVLEMFPKIHFLEENNTRSLSGEVDIFDTKSTYVDSYLVKIVIPSNYPYGFPLLFETGNKFEHTIDRHISNDGSCCVCSLQEADLIIQKGITIKSFFLEYVIPYLANQIYFDNSAHWANGDFDHGYEGILQYYKELFKINNTGKIFNLLSSLNTKRLNRNDYCFCGQKLKLKKCHISTYNQIKNLSKKQIEYDINALKELQKKEEKLINE